MRLTRDPRQPWRRWLALILFAVCGTSSALAVEWQSGSGFRYAALPPATGSHPGFTSLDGRETGLSFTNQASDAVVRNNQILENGAGIALGDVDGDGWCDVYLCGAENPNRLFRNLGGWKFADATAEAGVACDRQFSTGAAFADVDGDGDLDLFVNGLGVGTRLFRNDGRGHFTEDNASGLARNSAATSLAIGDVDGDGDLDVYVATYRSSSARYDPVPPRITARMVNGRVEVSPADRFGGIPRTDGSIEVWEKGEPDALYLNDGRGHFSAVRWIAGAFLDTKGQPLTEPTTAWGLSAMLRDFNGDGNPDLYVCNDFLHSRDEFWLGDGRGHFRAAPPSVWRSMPLSSMAVDVADLNRDGRDDFLVVEMLSRDHRTRQHQRANVIRPELNLPVGDPAYIPEVLRNTLQVGREDGTFADLAWFSGLAATDWSWGVAFLDVDLDGWEDILITTGNGHDVIDADAMAEADRRSRQSPGVALELYPKLDQPNLAFRNRGGLAFEDASAKWGFDDVGVSQSLALADLDNDGDLDVVVSNLNRATALYRNEATNSRIAVRLRGVPPNTAAIGARIRVISEAGESTALGKGKEFVQQEEIMAGGRYLSGDDAVRVFAASPVGVPAPSDSKPGVVSRLEVTWRSGRHCVVTNVAANRIYEIHEAAATEVATTALTNSPSVRPLFQDVSALLRHQHRDDPFDDFARQSLLPNRLSQPGPGVSWHDVDGDSRDDLIVASGKGGRPAVFQNDGRGGFTVLTNAALATGVTRDQTTVLGLTRQRGSAATLLAGSSNYDDGLAAGGAIRAFDLAAGTITDAIPAVASCPGPMAMADVDGDGDLDLFIGGRVVPGRYPEPASSQLLLQDRGGWAPDSRNQAWLTKLGLVSGAVFSDLDSDGDPDLVLACEWGPIRVFKNERGKFGEITRQLGLAGLTGLWNGVTTGDFDGDGRPDIVASNWGRNTRQGTFLPWQMLYGDFAGEGSVIPLEAFTDAVQNKVVAWRARDAVMKSWPAIGERFPTFRAFASASVEEILGPKFGDAQRLSLTTLDSTLFLNRGEKFEPHPLASEAQFTPAFGVVAADFNGDGWQDLFLAQNFFATEFETSRSDAGRGLLLLGDGRGGLRALPASQSGISVDGEQRGAAAGDFDADGRIDLAVGQNRGPTKLFKNASGEPGLRVHLEGPAGNPFAFGAAVRLRSESEFGPLVELHAGSGYCSEDSAAVVLPAVRSPSRLWIRWPGGATNEFALPSGARIVSVEPTKGIKILR